MRCVTCEQPPKSSEEWFCAKCYEAYRRTQHSKYASGEKNVEWGANRVRRTLLAEINRLTERCETLRELADTAAAGQGLALRRMEQAQQARTSAFEERNEAAQAAFQRGIEAMRAAVETYCMTAIGAAERENTKEFFSNALSVFRSVPSPEYTAFGELKQAQS